MRRIALILVVVMLGVFLAGCSVDDLAFYNTLNKINKLDNILSEEHVKLEISGEDYDQDNIINLLNGLELTSKTYASKSVNKIVSELGFKLPGDEHKQLTKVILDNKDVYIKVDTFQETLNYLYDKLGEEQEEIGIPEGVEYVKITVEEDYMDLKNQENIAETTVEMLKYIFEGFEANLVSKEGNKFNLEINDQKIADLLIRFIEYIVDNSEEVEKRSLEAVDNLTEDQFKMMNQSGYEISRDELKEGIKEIFLEISEETHKEYEDSIRESMNELEGLKVTASLEETDTGFVMTSEALLDSDNIKVKLTASSVVTKLDATLGDIAPKDNVFDATDNIFPDYATMFISLDTGDYDLYSPKGFSEGNLEFILEDGRTYLPLRAIGEMLGEDVQWDQEAFTPYINQDGVRIDMSGILVDGKAYVKLRDFEKLGYIVDWTEYDNTASILK